ncbi:glycoside hydrolase family 172 protein [Candidatus Latescibacterota bacterium]
MKLRKSMFIVPIIIVSMTVSVTAQNFGDLKELTKIKSDVKTKRVSSFDVTGGNNDRIENIETGEIKEIFNVSGAGIITHIWVTIAHNARNSRRNIILRMYWDGESEPSVESPIGDFFGNGWGEFYHFASLPLAVAPGGGGRAMTCYFPMPFNSGARITVENDSNEKIDAFYYYVDYEEHRSINKDIGRFHAWFNHEITEAPPEGENEWGSLGEVGNNDSGDNNYLFMDTDGAGQFIGVNYYVNCPSPMWYGEGDDMFFIDGESWPSSLHGTGTEDYFNMSWCPKELYQHPYFGLARVNKESGWMGRTHCYRFHIQDPVRFTKSLRATIEHGHNNYMTQEMSSVAYWYQTEPHKPFPEMVSRQDRRPKPVISATDIHRWRDAWRRDMGNDATLWGNENE